MTAQVSETLSLFALFRNAARQFPEKLALRVNSQELSYRELQEQVDVYARALLGLGAKHKDKIGILAPNCLEYVILLLALNSIGAVAVPINARFRLDELKYIISHSDITILFTSDLIRDYVDYSALLHVNLLELAAVNSESLQLNDAPFLKHIVLMGDRPVAGVLQQKDFLALKRKVPPESIAAARERVRPEDHALLMYTSGTTARPKGCLLTNASLVRNGRAAANRFRMTNTDRFWDPLPMFHMGAILPIAATFSSCAGFLSMTHFDAELALAMLRDYCATIAYPTFETITQALFSHPSFSARELQSIRLMLNVAAPDHLRQFQDQLPNAIQVSSYGATEMTGVIAYNSPDEDLHSRINTCGPPFEGIEVRILDPVAGATCPSEKEGEILVRGYALFDGYYKETDQQCSPFGQDGWFHTGDLGALTTTGNIMFRGRLKDMLKVGGENVAALEIESFLGRHPAVKIVQVVGVPDARLVEVPAAVLELHPGHSVTPEELIAFCQGQIASFKIPRYFRFVDEWPMSATKIQKFRLRETMIAELRASGKLS